MKEDINNEIHIHPLHVPCPHWGYPLIKNQARVNQILPYIDTLDTEYHDIDFSKVTMRSFVKYNDYMDKFRKTDSWRDLIPDLAKSIEQAL